MSCREYAQSQHPGWGHFVSKEPFLIYLHASSRMQVTHQVHSEPGFGMDRYEAIDERATQGGLSCSERDSQEFVQDFVSQFGEHLSVNQLKALIAGLQTELDDRLAHRRKAASSA